MHMSICVNIFTSLYIILFHDILCQFHGSCRYICYPGTMSCPLRMQIEIQSSNIGRQRHKSVPQTLKQLNYTFVCPKAKGGLTGSNFPSQHGIFDVLIWTTPSLHSSELLGSLVVSVSHHGAPGKLQEFRDRRQGPWDPGVSHSIFPLSHARSSCPTARGLRRSVCFCIRFGMLHVLVILPHRRASPPSKLLSCLRHRHVSKKSRRQRPMATRLLRDMRR